MLCQSIEDVVQIQKISLRLIQPTQAELLRAVDQRLGLDPQVRQMFQLLRQRGNEAAHQVDHRIGYREGLEALKVAREIALWFHRSFGSDADFKPGPFILPDDPSQRLLTLQQQVADLTQNLQQAQSEQAAKDELAELLAAQAAQERVLAERAAEERSVYESLAEEASSRYVALKAEFDAHLQAVNAAQAVPSSQDIQAFAQRTTKAAQKVTMDEASTRLLIDQMLKDAGWEADTHELTHAKGARPERNRNLAIAEWPTAGKQSAVCELDRRRRRARYVLAARPVASVIHDQLTAGRCGHPCPSLRRGHSVHDVAPISAQAADYPPAAERRKVRRRPNKVATCIAPHSGELKTVGSEISRSNGALRCEVRSVGQEARSGAGQDAQVSRSAWMRGSDPAFAAMDGASKKPGGASLRKAAVPSQTVRKRRFACPQGKRAAG